MLEYEIIPGIENIAGALDGLSLEEFSFIKKGPAGCDGVTHCSPTGFYLLLKASVRVIIY